MPAGGRKKWELFLHLQSNWWGFETKGGFYVSIVCKSLKHTFVSFLFWYYCLYHVF